VKPSANQLVSALIIILAAPLQLSGCSGSNTTPTSPTAPPVAVTPTVSLQSIRTTPSGTGVLHNTDFLFEAVGTFPAGSQFGWQFGDGSTATTTTSTANHVYSQTGSFGVTVDVRAGTSNSAATTQVAVRSMVGRWRGTVTGHTVYPPQRPIPIRSFDLVINTAQRPGADCLGGANASWADDAGCRRDRGICQSFTPRPTAEVSMSIESLSCNDGDFILRGTADARFDRVEGQCINGGPNCRFQMTRQ